MALKMCSPNLVPHSSRLFSLYLNVPAFPTALEHTMVSPISKRGDPSDLNKYYLTPLTHFVSKVLSAVFPKQLRLFLEGEGLSSYHLVSPMFTKLRTRFNAKIF